MEFILMHFFLFFYDWSSQSRYHVKLDIKQHNFSFPVCGVSLFSLTLPSLCTLL